MSKKEYLVCNNCKGYYQLQDGEKASDFEVCECGGSLSVYATLEKSPLYPSYPEPIEEDLKEKSDKQKKSDNDNNTQKTQKRKHLFKDLSNEVEVTEDVLIDIKDGKRTLIQGNGAQKAQKDNSEMMISSILAKESTVINESSFESIKEEESPLITQIRDKRSRARTIESSSSKGFSSIGRVVLILIIIFAILALVYFLFLK